MTVLVAVSVPEGVLLFELVTQSNGAAASGSEVVALRSSNRLLPRKENTFARLLTVSNSPHRS